MVDASITDSRMEEALEDIALVQAIREGEHSLPVARDEVFRILEA